MSRIVKRKSLRRAPPKKKAPAADKVDVMSRLLARCSTAPQDAEASMRLVLELHATVLALQGKKAQPATDTEPAQKAVKPWLDTQGFVRLNELNAATFLLAKEIYLQGNEETRKAVRPVEKLCNQTADALVAIGERFNKTGKYKGLVKELNALREMAGWFESLMDVATQGMTATALMGAANMVDQKLLTMQEEAVCQK